MGADTGLPPAVRFGGGRPEGEPLAFVLAKNLARRHLDTSQRAMIAGRLATMRQGERTDIPTSSNLTKSEDDAAKALNVSHGSVSAARMVLSEGAPDLIAAVDAGVLPVSVAKDVAADGHHPSHPPEIVQPEPS